MPEVIIVGSGAAGVAAALAFAERGVKPLILDVGNTRPEKTPRADGNLYAYRKQQDSFDLLIGQGLQSLSNLLEGEDVPVKLTTPNMAFVTKDAQRLSPIDASGFHAIQSFAAGGLANAWGAGLYRFVDSDLEGFPIRQGDLAPYFDRLTREIGISGTADDLAPFFGPAAGLLPPLRLSHNAGRLYRSYQGKKVTLNRGGFYLGLPRVGVLTRPQDGRSACDYSNLEFWQDLPYLYTPLVTLERLIARGQVLYRRGVLVECWSEGPDGIGVEGVQVDGGVRISFAAKKLVLAAGAINTAKITLATRRDNRTRLALLENPALQVPFILPTSVGRRLDTDAFGLVQLNLVWKPAAMDCTLQGSLMEITSPMRAEFFARFPLAAGANLALIRNMLPAMMVMQLFFPASCQEPARLSLQENGHLRIQGQPNNLDLRKIKDLFRYFRSLSAWSHPSLLVRVPTGHAIHYAGTLPMKLAPQEYECDPAGRLQGSQNVFVADASSFPRLPAKNVSFAMMANAMRVVDRVADELGRTP